MFITQKELDRRIEAAVKSAQEKWEAERWRERQIDDIRGNADCIRKELYDRFDALNERLFVVERKTGAVKPPEPLSVCGHPCYQEAQAPAPQTGEART